MACARITRLVVERQADGLHTTPFRPARKRHRLPGGPGLDGDQCCLMWRTRSRTTPGPACRRSARIEHMGTFSWPLRISDMNGGASREIEATVDTGAAYTTLPARLLRELGIEPIDRGVFLLADGRRMEMEIGRAWATINGTTEVTLVVFGEDDAPPLLGAYTLEGLRLAVDPVAQRLVPTHLIMY